MGLANNFDRFSSASRYFDHAATTPLDPRVLEAMLPFLTEEFGNANSIHRQGRRAADAVQQARIEVAQLLGVDDPDKIFFTSGATEANNWLVRGFSSGIVSPFEHSSLLNAAQRAGWEVWDPCLTMPDTPFEIASLMSVNNETGALWDIRGLAGSGQFLHADATQAVGKIPFSVDGLDFASMSAHKIYGPKGVGALYCAEYPPEPLLIGGEQEHGFRSGTLNVPGIVGLGKAAAIAVEELEENFERTRSLREAFLDRLSTGTDYQVLGGSKTSPFILCISFMGVEGEALVIESDRAGYSISSGAACSSRSTEPSHVLVAMGLDEITLRGAVRISFGKSNNIDSTVDLAAFLVQSVENLRTLSMSRSTLRNAEQGNARL